MKTLAELVRQYRSDARLSQEDLAERAGLSPRTISNIETGIAASPRAITLSLLVEALGLDAERRERLAASIRRQTAGTRNPRKDGDSSPAFRRLPPAPTPFIGREAEVAACSDLLRRTDIRLVTLIGGAGVGKTSLALAVAHAIENDFDGGVLFVELAGVPEHAFVATKILFEAGAREVEGEELAETIASSLGKRRTLLALDTFEQVTGAAPFVANLLAAAPELKIFVTSRNPLRISAERQFPLAPLARDAAITMLVERARTLRPNFAVTNDKAASVAAVAERLEDLPLAIELAAPLLKLMSPAALASRLEKRLPLLVSRGHELPSRQRTMRAALDWSYALLSLDEQRLFARLSVLRGSFTAEAARAVAGAEELTALEVLRELATLVDYNLARVVDEEDAEPRFLFSDLVREYAEERMAASGESDATFVRLAEHLIAQAQLFKPGDSSRQMAPILAGMVRDSANFDAVLQWALDPAWVETGLRLAVALREPWWFQGAFLARSARLRPLLEVAESRELVNGELLADAYAAAGRLAEASGDLSAAQALLEKALRLKQQLGNPAAVATLLTNIATVAMLGGHCQRARVLYEQGLEIRLSLDDHYGIGVSLLDLGMLEADEGNSIDAIAHLENALGHFRDADNDMGIGYVFVVLATIAVRDGLADRAETFGMEGLRIGRLLGQRMLVAWSTDTQAWVAFLRGAYADAERGFREALELSAAIGDRLIMPDIMDGLAATLHALCDAREAARLLGQSDAMRRRWRKDVVPTLREWRERLIATVRDALGAEAFDAEWNVGSSRRM